MAAMREPALSQRLARLDALAARLSDGELHAVAALSAELGVSPRTLARDLSLLRARGWDLESASGLGGGVRLNQRWAVSPISLRRDDALSLLLALGVAEALGLSLGAQPAVLRGQLTRGFAPADRADIARLRSRLRVASALTPDAVLRLAAKAPTEAVRAEVLPAFVAQRLLSLRYQDGQARASERRVEPQVLLLAWPAWYLIAWDLDRAAVRTFRLDRIRQAHALPDRFRLRPPAPFWASCDNVGQSL
jgi:predicted DNA-binding transcriptional regulator YafY